VLTVAGFYGCLPAFMVEVVPREVRCTATAMGYNISLGLLGGLSPFAATWLVDRTENDYSPAFMIIAAAAISFIALLTVRTESTLRPVEAIASPAAASPAAASPAAASPAAASPAAASPAAASPAAASTAAGD
jgi:MHS family proline/betaine transporter-like MFS transporter